jgi:hypothetical protein
MRSASALRFPNGCSSLNLDRILGGQERCYAGEADVSNLKLAKWRSDKMSDERYLCAKRVSVFGCVAIWSSHGWWDLYVGGRSEIGRERLRRAEELSCLPS